VPVTPPAFETPITFTATAPSDEACDTQSGQLLFSVAASPALSAEQYNGATFAVTKGGVWVTGCTSTPSADRFEVTCTGLAAGSYDLAVSVPNTQYAGALLGPQRLSGRWPGLFGMRTSGCITRA
jgi:hypothetical protein